MESVVGVVVRANCASRFGSTSSGELLLSIDEVPEPRLLPLL